MPVNQTITAVVSQMLHHTICCIQNGIDAQETFWHIRCQEKQIPIFNKKVGIMTVDAQFLSPESLRCVGIDESVPHVVYGLENSGLFVKETDPDKRRVALENILVPAAEAMIRENPDVAAIVYECTLLAPTSAAVQKATGLPVFDVITLIKWAFSAVVQKKYDGYV